MKNYLSSLSPIHSKEEEQEPVLVENETEAPYLSEASKNAAHNGPDKSVITDDIVITGSVTASRNLDIFGTIHGNVSSNGDILLAGTMEGDLNARQVHFSKAHLKGNITAEELVVLEDESIIEGDIQTADFILNGKMSGNIKASGNVNLKSSAELTGDIEANAIEVARGAVFNGSISIKR